LPRKPLNISAQKGTAIIVALFVMSIVAAASVAMIVRLHIDIRRTELLLNADRAYLYAQGSIAWAQETLMNDIKQQKPKQPVDATPITSKTDNQDGFQIQSTIYDAQGFFNLNNLNSNDNLNDFVLLLKAIEPELSPAAAKPIATAIHDWVVPASKDSTADTFYTTSNPPYSPTHALMASSSELRLVKGMTAALYTKLLPYIIALPEATVININNAPIPLLMSLNADITPASAKAIEQCRKQTPFTEPTPLQNCDVIKNNPLDPKKITFVSNYFLVKTSVKVGQQQTILYTLLKRTVEKSKPAITVLWQTKGTL
jgi:general secretion pathway protein K